jgi:SAM-dependent methyltransferase
MSLVRRAWDRLLRPRRDIAATRCMVEDTSRLLVELTTFVHERLSPPDSVDDLTKAGWRRSAPSVGLTWNTERVGAEFLGRVTAACGSRFSRILEIGPGDGRVLKALLASDVSFDEYHGLDISAATIRYLSSTFKDGRVRFTNGDFLELEVPAPVQLIYSSAVFLHLYPDIAPALRWCRRALSEGGHVCFDVPQGNKRYIDADWGIYVREYIESQLRDLVDAAAFVFCQISTEREFAPGLPGLFVAARK